MNNSHGIFDQYFANESNGPTNPFSFAAETPVSNPFSSVPLVPQSPFTAMPDTAQDRNVPEPGKPAKIPAPRNKVAESPFQVVADNANHFGYEAPQISPFAFALAPPPRAAVPIVPINLPQAAPPPSQPNPFSFPREAAFSAPGYGAFPESVFLAPQAYPAPNGRPFYQEETQAFRQLELRAIFGVDREMSSEEILQRSRSLPGVKLVSRIASHDVIAFENLKGTLQSLGFGSGNLRLYSGSVPIEFVREGATILAVQTDGGFAPGIRETMMIVARELDKMGSM